MNCSFVRTNIINVCADAIVLPANTALKEGSGTSRAIFNAAGRRQLTKACKELKYCKEGNAVPTLAFNLHAKYIIHAVVPKWVDGEHEEYELLSSAYFVALSIADILGCESIAFPLLAAGNNGFDTAFAFEIARQNIESYQATSLKKAILVLYTDTAVSIAEDNGCSVMKIPEKIRKKEKTIDRIAEVKKVLHTGKDTAQSALTENLDKAIIWMQKPENMQKIFDAAMFTARNIVGMKNGKITGIKTGKRRR